MAKIPEQLIPLARYATACVVVMSASFAGANVDSERQSLPELADAVQQRLLDHYLADQRFADVQITTNTPDARLRLVKCDQPLTITPPQNSAGGRVTSQVACRSATTQWSVYVVSQVQLMAQVVVARVPLLRGQAISQDDVSVVVSDVTRLGQGFYSVADDIVGMEPKRSINPGDQIRAQWLVAPKAIKRGQRVTIIAKSATVAVEASGTALSDGRLGDQIRVRNERSDRVVKGVVSADRVITIAL